MKDSASREPRAAAASGKQQAARSKRRQWQRRQAASAFSLLLTASAFSGATAFADQTAEFIVKGSYCDKAGLKEGDVVQEIDGKPTTSGKTLEVQIAEELTKQNHVRIKIQREGKEQILRLREKSEK